MASDLTHFVSKSPQKHLDLLIHLLLFSPARVCLYLVESVECVLILSSFSTDVATVVGYLVVSRPFLNLSHPRHLRSSHSDLLEV